MIQDLPIFFLQVPKELEETDGPQPDKANREGAARVKKAGESRGADVWCVNQKSLDLWFPEIIYNVANM